MDRHRKDRDTHSARLERPILVQPPPEPRVTSVGACAPETPRMAAEQP